MPGTTYSLYDLVGKTIFAAGTVPVYQHANDHAAPAYSISTGQPIGVLYSWLDPNPTYDRGETWFMYWPDNAQPYYTKWGPGMYNFDALEAQGLMTDEEKAAAAAAAEAEANKPWYQKIISQVAPWVLGAIVVGAVVKGGFTYLSTRKASKQ